MPAVPTTDHKGKRNRDVYYSEVLEQVTTGYASRGDQAGQARVQTERDKIWDACLYEGPWVASLGVPGLRTNRSVQTEKGRVLLDFSGFLPKGDTGKGTGRQRRLSITRAAGEVLSGTYTDCHIGHALAWGGRGSVQGPHRPLGQTK